MVNVKITGILSNTGGLWQIQLTQSHFVPIGIENFEGRFVKVTRTPERLIIEVTKQVEPESAPTQAKELCMAVS